MIRIIWGKRDKIINVNKISNSQLLCWDPACKKAYHEIKPLKQHFISQSVIYFAKYLMPYSVKTLVLNSVTADYPWLLRQRQLVYTAAGRKLKGRFFFTETLNKKPPRVILFEMLYKSAEGIWITCYLDTTSLGGG